MHIIITGKPGAGKSTLARYLLSGFGEKWAGYRTIKGESGASGTAYLLESWPEGERLPISRPDGDRMAAVPETFETLGVSAIRRALDGPEPIVLLDEVGRFERNSPAFLAAVKEALLSEKTVIAVLKKEPLPHLEQFRHLQGEIFIDLDQCTPQEARKRLTDLLWPDKALRWGLTLRLFGVDKSFGPGPMALLEGTDRTGSLHRAAAEMGMSYSKAWKLIGKLEDSWGFPLLERHTGGVKGGCSSLTPEGADLLARYRAMLDEVERAAEAAFQTHFGDGKLF